MQGNSASTEGTPWLQRGERGISVVAAQCVKYSRQADNASSRRRGTINKVDADDWTCYLFDSGF